MDVFKYANYIGLLNLEHFFVNLDNGNVVIYPTGEVVSTNDALFNEDGTKKKMIEHQKRIGFSLGRVHDYYNYERANKEEARAIGKKYKNKGVQKAKLAELSKKQKRVPIPVIVMAYNYFSLNYIEWQRTQLSAMSARKKIVTGG